MKLRLISIIATLFCVVGSVFAQMQNPVHWSYNISQIQEDGTVTVTFSAAIDKPWHMYHTEEPADGPLPTAINYTSVKNAEPVGNLKFMSKLITKFEQAFGMNLKYYENSAVFQQVFKVNDVYADVAIEGNVEYMCCDDQMCLPPTKSNFSLSAKGLEKVAANVSTQTLKPAPSAPAKQEEPKEVKKKVVEEVVPTTPIQKDEKMTEDSDAVAKNDSTACSFLGTSVQLTAYGETETGDTSLWTIFLSGLLGGFIAVVTPCVWPIIPMTVSYFLKRSEDKSKGRQQAVLYGLSIVIIYVVLGLCVTAFFSANTLNELSTSKYLNVFLFLLLVVFACSFFGGFEIMLPASWSSKIDAKAEKISGVFGILLMACTLVIVSFSCTGPIIGTLLVSVSREGNILAPAVGMFGFALALAIPFTLFAFFPSMIKSMPRSGNWLNMVKVLLGFFELAFSLKFLSVADQSYHWGLLSRPTFISIWIVIFVLAGVYLLGKLKLPHDTDMPNVSVPRLLLALCSFSFAVYLLPGLFGAPLNAISAFAPPFAKTDASFYPGVKVEPKYYDFDVALRNAKEQDKPLLVDFSGHGCVNCRKMESAVWTDPSVASLMTDNCVLVTLYCDDRTPLKEPIKVIEGNETKVLETVGEKWSYLQRQYGNNAQPYYIMVAPNKSVYKHYFKFTEDAGKFREFIIDGIETLSNEEK